MTNSKCLHIQLKQVKQDPALAPGKWGARKIVVTEVIKGKEYEATNDIWVPAEECPVLQMSNAEMAVFNEQANQDRHYHKEGTEIYEAIEGEVNIEVEEKIYLLKQGDMIVVSPFSIHEVKKEGNKFLCRVITLNCKGERDKFLV